MSSPFPPASTSPQEGLPKTYRPADHEERITARWLAAKAFAADPSRVLRGEAEPYCILIPPPNVTAALHLGHALNNTLQDVLARAHRMMGYETLWMPGTDHAGIATQAVVEKRLLKDEGKRRKDYARDEFVAKVQSFKDEYEATITAQLRAMGCSCDWDRQRFTMDEQCAAAVREAFFNLFRDGLIYRGKRLVNWDPELQTAVADDECDEIEAESFFYYMRYPVVRGTVPGGSESRATVTWNELARLGYPGAERHPGEQQAWVTVATTRPETYLGDTAVAVNPRDPRANALRGLFVVLPLVGRVIPIVEDDYVVLPAAMQADPDAAAGDPKAAYATGFLKVTPAHDMNDYELGRRHGLPLVNVFAPDATITDNLGWGDVGDARLFVGLSREEARKKVVAEFKARGLLEETRPYKQNLKISDRTKSVIEPYLSDQWFVKVADDRMAGSANRAMVKEQRAHSEGGEAAAGDGGLEFHPARYAKTYEQWHNGIRDWCISRQLWWGHRIPVWTATNPSQSAVHRIEALASKSKLPSIAVVRNGDKVHVCLRTEDAFQWCENEFDSAGFAQDPDVLDTWFSSGLWPLSTMGWPDPGKFNAASNRGLLEAFNPTSVLCTAREIITLWVSRMVMFNRYFMNPGAGRGPVPFRDVFIHAMIQDGEGRKMSKSLGNGVDPRDIIASHGADAMRFTLVQMTTQTQDVRMPVVPDPTTGKNTSPKFDIGRNLCNKLWNASRFTLTMLERAPSVGTPQASTPSTLIDRWMLSRLAASIDTVKRSIRGYEFNEYAAAIYDLLWRDFCDWYLEGVKPTVDGDHSQRAVLRATLDAIIRLMHPIAPFITEAIHEHLREVPLATVPGLALGEHELLCRAQWPAAAESLRDEAAEHDFERLRGFITAIRQLRSDHNVQPKRKIVLHVAESGPLADLCVEAGGRALLIRTLAGVERIESQPPREGSPAVSFRFEGAEAHVSSLADAVDASAEQERLRKMIEDADRTVDSLTKRIENPGYMQKAPPKLVEETRAQLNRARQERAAAAEALSKLL